jgi:hypothetical protein
MSWCHGGAEIVIHPGMGIMKVHDTVPCQSRLISKHDVSYKLCLQCILRESTEKHRPFTMAWRSEGLQSLAWRIIQTRGTPILSAAAMVDHIAKPLTDFKSNEYQHQLSLLFP